MELVSIRAMSGTLDSLAMHFFYPQGKVQAYLLVNSPKPLVVPRAALVVHPIKNSKAITTMLDDHLIQGLNDGLNDLGYTSLALIIRWPGSTQMSASPWNGRRYLTNQAIDCTPLILWH
jgi:hypothetical protein